MEEEEKNGWHLLDPVAYDRVARRQKAGHELRMAVVEECAPPPPPPHQVLFNRHCVSSEVFADCAARGLEKCERSFHHFSFFLPSLFSYSFSLSLSLSLSLWWYAQIGEIHTATLLFFRWRMPTKKKLLINPVKNAIPHLCLFNFYRPIHYTEVMLMKCPVQLWKFRFRWKYHHIFLENSKTGIVWMKLQHPFP